MAVDSPYAYAKIHAKKFQEKYSDFFVGPLWLGNLENILKILRIELDETADMGIVGRLENRIDYDKIVVNSKLSTNEKIQVISHELGHWFLGKYYPDIEKRQPVYWKEKYAQYFANELRIPVAMRCVLAAKLLTSKSAREILQIATTYKVSPLCICSIMYSEKSERLDETNMDNIWLIAKWSANKKTLTDGKLRVIAGYFDTEKFFVAYNQGVDKVINNSVELTNLIPGKEIIFESNVTISTRSQNRRPEYVKKVVQATCSVIRLLENRFDNTASLVLLLRIDASLCGDV